MPKETQQPLLPPEPILSSEVAVRLIVAGVIQLLSICFRVIGHIKGVEISTEWLDQLTADLSQVVALGFLVLAFLKRKNSPIQPLTMTKAGAEAKANTSIIDKETLANTLASGTAAPPSQQPTDTH